MRSDSAARSALGGHGQRRKTNHPSGLHALRCFDKRLASDHCRWPYSTNKRAPKDVNNLRKVD